MKFGINDCGSVVEKRFLGYALPSIVGMLIVSFQMMIDGIFVSKGVGALGLAAVNISMPLINALLSVCIMIVSGGVVIAGIAKGSGDDALARGFTTLTFVLLLGTCLFMSAVLMLNIKDICYLLGSDDNTYPYVRTYLGILVAFFFFYCIPNFTEAFTRFVDKPNWVFVSGVICCVVNVVLDYFFVIRWQWGMSGAAYATVIANTSAAVVLAPNLKMGRIRGGLRDIWRVFYNGSSEMLTAVSSAVTMCAFNIVLMNDIGAKGVAAFTIVYYMNMIVNMSIFGLSQALYPLMSYGLGAGNYDMIRRLLGVSMKTSAVIGVSVFIVIQLFKRPIIRVFSNDDTVLFSLAVTAATYVTLHYLVSFVNILGSSFHTAVEKPLESVAIALCRSLIFVLIPLFVLPRYIGDMGIWIAMPVAEVATLFVTVPMMIKSMRRLHRNLATVL